jgi:hypothetical protein
MTFRIGQKVECIREAGIGKKNLETDARFGEVYTIRGFLEYDGILGLFLQEIINPPTLTTIGVIERAMTASRFRPIVECKADISVFTALLNTSNREKINAS